MSKRKHEDIRLSDELTDEQEQLLTPKEKYNRAIECTRKRPKHEQQTLFSMFKPNEPEIILDDIRPFVKWPGGKTSLMDTLTKYIPTEIHNYFEPFIGGGSVFMHLLLRLETKRQKLHGKLYLNDINPKLVSMYECVRDDVEGMIGHLRRMVTLYLEAELLDDYDLKAYKADNVENEQDAFERGKAGLYYYYRDLLNVEKDKAYAAALFVFINKTCFRGVYRENSEGKFNISFGRFDNPNIYDARQLRSLSNVFKKHSIEFSVGDFATFCEGAQNADDFVYLDPPYYPQKDKAFTGYAKDDFSTRHKDLVTLCVRLHENGIKFIHSNSNCDYNHENYTRDGFTIDIVKCVRYVNHRKRDKDEDGESQTNEQPKNEEDDDTPHIDDTEVMIRNF